MIELVPRQILEAQRTKRQLRFGYPVLVSETFRDEAVFRHLRIGQSGGEPMEHAKVSMIKLGVGYSTREKERRRGSASAAVHTISRISAIRYGKKRLSSACVK